VPSAGARYPLEIHLIAWSIQDVIPGTYRYLSTEHSLESTGITVAPQAASDLFLGQQYITAASAVIVITATLGPSLSRYGERGYRYILFEAGHVAQNLNLTAAALRLGSLNLGGFLDQRLGETLRLAEHVPLYGVAVGRPLTTDQDAMRVPAAGSSFSEEQSGLSD
jgi:SagB-type dehydrogenase family enzyme